ncbi:Mitochondrial pyruvate carrier 2 [Schaereria dolodes]|nr:Mitochondrial pyruvate carrier 2 [Schaereria dolodes]
MSSGAAFRLIRVSRAIRTPFRRPLGRRHQTTGALSDAQAESLGKRLWNSPVGVKTVHFWAPVMKWALVIAGASDFWRPAEKLSLSQNLALTATGIIWTRWCFIIKPKNILLAAVNFLLGCVGFTQVTRILLYQRKVKNGTITKAAEDDAIDAIDTAKDIARDTAGAAEDTMN